MSEVREFGGIELPSDETSRTRIINAIEEINDHQIHIISHREAINEIIKVVAEETKMKGPTLRRFAKWRLKGNRDEEVGKISDEDAAFDILFERKDQD